MLRILSFILLFCAIINTAFSSQADTIQAYEYLQKAIKYNNEANYQKSLDFYKKSLEEYKKCSIVSNDKIAYIHYKIGLNYFYISDFHNSIDYILIAYNLYKSSQEQDKDMLAQCLNDVGAIYYYKANYSEASEYWEKALKLRIENFGEENEGVADTYNNIALLYYDMGNYEKSRIYHDKALKIRSQIFGNKSVEVFESYNNIAMLFERIGNYDSALYFNNITLKFRTRHFGLNHQQTAMSYNNAGRIYTEFGNYKKASKYYEKALSILENVHGESHSDIAAVLCNLGILYYDLGDYDKALIYLKNSNNIIKDLFNERHEDIGDNYVNIGAIYFELGDYEKALHYYNEALAIRKQVFGEEHRSTASVYSDIGNTHYASRNYRKAIFFQQKALKIRKSVLPKNHHHIALSYDALGLIYETNIDELICLNYYNLALEVKQNAFGEKHPDISNTCLKIGTLHFKNKHYEKALEYFQKGLIANNMNFNSQAVENNPSAEGTLSNYLMIEILSKKAEALKKINASKKLIFETYLAAIDILNDSKRIVTTKESKFRLQNSGREIYKNAIEYGLQMYQQKTSNQELYEQQLFQIFQQTKASVLFEAVKDEDLKIAADIPDSLLKKETSLKEAITAFDHLIYKEQKKYDSDSNKIQLWNDQLISYELQLDKLRKHIESIYTSYSKFKNQEKLFSPGQIMEALAEDEIILEYLLDEEDIYAVFISKQAFEIKRMQIDSSFYARVNNFRSYISAFSPKAKRLYTRNNFIDDASYFYNLLIAPFSEKIKNKNLIIIPDDLLTYLPFELFIRDKSNLTNDFRKLPYLFIDHNISYHYSLGLYFHTCKLQNLSNKDEALAMAVSFEQLNNQLMAINRNRGTNLATLTGAVKEVEALAKIYKSNLLLNEQATENFFKKNASKYKILHIDTHGIIDDVNPMYSGLVFHPKDSLDDGFLCTSEIMNMKLHNELTVLSACNSGHGKLYKGEGIMTMARGFISSGVTGIVISMYNVNDESSVEIMKWFYENLKKGMPKDEALRKAKINYLENADNITSHPYFWSNYILVGNKKPLTAKPLYWPYIIIGLSALFLLVFVLKRKRGLRKS